MQILSSSGITHFVAPPRELTIRPTHGTALDEAGARCKRIWTDEWSCTCDDDCPHYGARHMSPCHSEDVTEFIERDGNQFVAIRSPDTAEHDPDYRELGRFPTREKAEEFLASVEME